MEILFITPRNAGVTSDQIAAARRDEVRAVWQLVKAGTIREIYFSPERPAVVGVLECASVDEARGIMTSLPMARLGLIDFEFHSLAPYDQLEMLFER
jgi:hypothetical protein